MTNTEEARQAGHKFPSGTWVNQLGSELTFTTDPLGGLHGEYCGGAGALAGHHYAVVGSIQPDPVGHAVPIAFLVRWSEAHCLTTWCGHYFPDSGEIHATWLMSSEAETADEWRSTMIGHDIFHRQED